MKSLKKRWRWSRSCALIWFLAASSATAQTENPLIGIWQSDDGHEIGELLFRPGGRYQLDTRSTDPVLNYSSTERGYYQLTGQTLRLQPYDRVGEPEPRVYAIQLAGSLTLTRVEFELTYVYQFKPGSREEVLANEQVAPVLIGSWGRDITFYGNEEYTFRPGGYFFVRSTPEGGQFPPEIVRGRYQQDGNRLIIKPYGGIEAELELDFFGNTVTLLKQEQFSGTSASYDKVPGSEAEVRSKADEAAAFLSRENWQVGLWEFRDEYNQVDLTLRPDGHYISVNHTEILQGTVRGRYTLEQDRIRFFPFPGQDIYSRDNGEFGKVERTRAIDYYDGELQIIDLEAISQSVSIARKRPGTEEAVIEKVRQAQVERGRDDWHVGIWRVDDPSGWMEFTFRPDNRYITQAGTESATGEVERGRYLISPEKVTLAPYSGLGPARGFEHDFYDGDLFLIGDSHRLVIARKVPGSETEVVEKTLHPVSAMGEHGPVLGRWTARLPGEFVELVFRPDGEFRLNRCSFSGLSQDYGLYTADTTARRIVSDSRFTPVQILELDYYGDTLTLFGGHQRPATYTVNPGTVDASIEASLAADAVEAQIDAQWMARVPIGLRNPNAVQIPTGDIPADPNPGLVFEGATVFNNYQLYRRLIPGFVYFNYLGTIRSVAVVHTGEWHFFPTGRVLVRFKNYSAGPTYPTTIATVSDSWGAYRIGPKPQERDILHLYADNSLFIETDLGEQTEMTLEDGRRHLFWEKDYQILSEWAAERQPIPCEAPEDADMRLINTGVSLSTTIAPDDLGEPESIPIQITLPGSGGVLISGATGSAGRFVVERATSLAQPITWHGLQTNDLPAGPFSLAVPQEAHSAAFFRLRRE